MKLAFRSLIPCCAILLLTVAPAAANPVLEGSIHTHVQPYDEYAPILTDCSQLVQHITDEGWVDFDFYLYQRYTPPPYGVDSCEIHFTWPSDWFFDVGWYDYPHDGTGEIYIDGNQATVYITYPNCPTTQGELFLLMRCSFLVEGYGQVEPLDEVNFVDLCPYGGLSGFPGFGGEAGVVCEYDYVDCNLDHYCHPKAQTPLLQLQADMGEPLTAELLFDLCPQGGSTCSPFFRGSEDWMNVSAGEVSDCDYPVTLEIDTSTLAPGEYSGWVEAEDRGAGCTRVDLTVLDLTGVERQSWSLIKSLY